jgi:hypothetical protein
MPAERARTSSYAPRPPELKVNGRIVSVYRGVAQAGRNSVVAMNVGSPTVWRWAHVLADQGSARAQIPTAKQAKASDLPGQSAGHLLVFRVFDKIAYGLIMDASHGHFGRRRRRRTRTESPMPGARTGAIERAAWLHDSSSLRASARSQTPRSARQGSACPKTIFRQPRRPGGPRSGRPPRPACSTTTRSATAAIRASLDWAEQPHHLLTLAHPAYPARLLQSGDPPPAPVRGPGPPELLSGPALAIVGSRSATRGGIETARSFARSPGRTGRHHRQRPGAGHRRRGASRCARHGWPHGQRLSSSPRSRPSRRHRRALGGFKKQDDYYESDDFVLSSAVGHLLELAVPEEFEVKRGQVDVQRHLPVIPPHFDLSSPSRRTRTGSSCSPKLIKRKDVDRLVNACDAGREGELIFRNIVAATPRPSSRSSASGSSP